MERSELEAGVGESQQRGKVGCSRENSLEPEERSEQRDLPWGPPHVLRDPQCKTVLLEKPQETGPRPRITAFKGEAGIGPHCAKLQRFNRWKMADRAAGLASCLQALLFQSLLMLLLRSFFWRRI